MYNKYFNIKSAITLALYFIVSHAVTAQIYLNNPSFEDTPGDATTPMGWFECEEWTTPDILPGFWGVYEEASEGDTYVGIITRENNTFESIGQRVSEPLTKNVCYAFTIDLAHSKTYAGFNKPIHLRVWIGSTKCSRDQMILETELVDHEEWKKYPIRFTPEQDSYYLIFEAYYPGMFVSRKSNLLMDNITAIRFCSKV